MYSKLSFEVLTTELKMCLIDEVKNELFYQI